MRVNPSPKGPSVLSVTTDPSVLTSNASFRTAAGASTDDAPPNDAFSSLIGSNPDPSNNNGSDTPQPTPSQAAATTTPPVTATSAAPPRDSTTAAQPSTSANQRNGNQTAANDNGGAAAPATQPLPATTAPANSAPATPNETTVATVVTSGLAAGVHKPSDAASGKTAQNEDDTGDTGSSPDGAAQVAPIAAPAAIVVAIVVSTTTTSTAARVSVASGAATPITSAGTSAVAPAPGAIAAAAANRVAADIGATPASLTPALGGAAAQPLAAGVQDKTRAGVQSAPLSVAPLTTQSNVAAGGKATAVVPAEVPPLTQPGTQAAPTKAGKTDGSVEDAKGTASDTNQAAVPVSQPSAPASSAPSDPTNAKTPSGSTPQDSQPDASAKPLANADSSAAPTPASPSAGVDPRTVSQGASTPATSDASTIAQAPFINVPLPAPTTAANATPINVANLTVVAGPAVPLNGLAVEIAANSKAGNSRFQIRLDPPDLGRIDVRLDVDRNGQVTSRLFVEKSETLDLLRRDAPQLHQALQDAGLKTSDHGLQFSLRDQNPQQGRNDGNGTGQGPQRLVIAEEDPAVAEAAGRSYARSLSTAGGVDIRV